MNLRDTIERLFWTFVAAFLGSVLGSPLLLAAIEGMADVAIDLEVVQLALLSGLVAGVVAVANAVLIIARSRLAVLPNPGAGLPGLPTGGGA